MEHYPQPIESGVASASAARSWVLAALVFGLAMSVVHTVSSRAERHYIETQELAARYWADAFATRIEGRVQANLAVGLGIVAQVKVLGTLNQRQFEVLAEQLMSADLDVRHVGIAPDLVIRAIHPLHGNEKALGLDYRTNPEQRALVEAALATDTILIDGPLTLVQGVSNQLLARLPVINRDGSGWGMVSVVIDIERLLRGSALENLQHTHRVLLKKHSGGGAIEVIAGDRKLTETHSVQKKIHFPGNTWSIALAPVEGWGLPLRLQLLHWSLGLMISATLAAMFFFIHRNFRLKRQHIAQLRSMLAIDPLTQLSSRYQLAINLNNMVDEHTHNGDAFALLMIDIDHFKEVNDSLGHATGDKILVELAKRLRTRTRNYDLLARMGGDEFVVVLKGVASTKAIESQARSIMAGISEPMNIGGHSLSLNSSIGVSLFPIDAEDAQSLLQHADLAVFESKRLGRNSVYFFDAARRAEADRFVVMSAELKNALDKNLMDVHFQPIYNVGDKVFSHCEALCRWHKADGTSISPGEFIPVAERSGLIGELGSMVIHRALELSQRLRQGGHTIKIAINRSPSEFASKEYTEQLIRALNQQKLSSHDIIFEITESLFMADNSSKTANYWKLKKVGFQFAIDDFGIGYSSINYLRQFPVEMLKIDQSFVAGIITDNHSSRKLVEAIVSMAKALGMKTVAEGVETEAQALFLQRIGCDYLQGYYFAKPMDANQVCDFFARQQVVAEAMKVK